MSEQDIISEPELPTLPVTPQTVQFPALSGDEAGEVAHRSADSPVAGFEGWFHRVFHLGRLGIAADSEEHLRNAGEVVADAIRRGLHPKGDVHLVGHAEHDEPRSKHTTLTYAVDVTPASVDHDAASTVTPTVITEGAREVEDEPVAEPQSDDDEPFDAPEQQPPVAAATSGAGALEPPLTAHYVPPAPVAPTAATSDVAPPLEG